MAPYPCDMRAVMDVETCNLTPGDVVLLGGAEARVSVAVDTGRVAVFGTGTEWHVALDTPRGPRELSAPAGHVWCRL